jgi:hypothetical protein
MSQLLEFDFRKPIRWGVVRGWAGIYGLLPGVDICMRFGLRF